MPNFDGQYEVRIFYDTTPTGFTLLNHTLTFDVLPDGDPAPGTSFAGIPIIQRNGAQIDLDVAVDAFVAGMTAIYSTSSTINRAELWYIPEGTYAGTFISTYPINEPGLSAGDEQVAQQVTLTFRSVGGGNGRLQFMEPVTSGNGQQTYPYTPSAYDAIADLVTAPTGFIIARDNTYMFANIRMSSGQNERLFRKRYRSS